MSAAWVGYALVIGILLAVAAAAVEPLARLVRLPTRYVWLVAMVATIGLAAVAPVRREATIIRPPATDAGPVVLDAGALGGFEERVVPVSPTQSPGLAERIRDILAAVPNPGPTAFRLFYAAWLTVSLSLLLLVLVVRRRYRGMLSRSPARSVQGTPVRMTDATGPAVLGVLQPEIAVPAWLLAAPTEVQRIVLLHEREHVRSGDPLILSAGGTMVILVPWLLPLWWMYRRLRLAVEVDCDARVLRAGVPLREYGSALIEVAGHSPRFAVGLPITLGTRSSLEQRLKTMNRKPTGRRIALAAPLMGLGITAMLVACETKLPTSAEIQAMDVNAIEQSLGRVGITGVDADQLQYFIVPADLRVGGGDLESYRANMAAITAEEARAIPADRIAAIRVGRAPGADRTSEIYLVLREEGAAATTPSMPLHDVESMLERELASASEAPAEVRSISVRDLGTPLYVIDGVVTDAAGFNRLNPADIETIMILKDIPEDVELYRGYEGGVVVLTKAYSEWLAKQRAAGARVYSTVPGPEPRPSYSIHPDGTTEVWERGSSVTRSGEERALTGSSDQSSVGQGILSANGELLVPSDVVVTQVRVAPRLVESGVAAEPNYQGSYGVRSDGSTSEVRPGESTTVGE